MGACEEGADWCTDLPFPEGCGEALCASEESQGRASARSVTGARRPAVFTRLRGAGSGWAGCIDRRKRVVIEAEVGGLAALRGAWRAWTKRRRVER